MQHLNIPKLYLNGKYYSRSEFAGLFGVTWGTIRRKQRKGMDAEAIVRYYEKRHGKTYRPTSTLREVLTALGHWYNGGRMTFFKVGEVLGGELG